MSKKKLLSKADILAAQDLKLTEVSVPEWGGAVCLKVLSGHERVKFEEFITSEKRTSMDTATVLLAASVVDEALQPIFTEEDYEALGKKNANVLLDLCQKALKLNKLGDGDLEDAEKNSKKAQGDVSSSD